MPLHTRTARAPRLLRLGRVAALAAVTCATAGTVSTAIADDQPAATRYFDIEANKAASMRALGHHIAEQRTDRTSHYRGE